MKKLFNSEYIRRRDGSEVCSECGMPWNPDGPVHVPDCRYFFIEDEADDLEREDLALQMSLFRPAA
jgi:hypothetical protein